MWKQYYNTSSGRDCGTLYQLRNLIYRRNVIKKPMDNLDACEDFIVLVKGAHILSAAMTIFNMNSLDDRPSTVVPLLSGHLGFKGCPYFRFAHISECIQNSAAS